MRNLYLAFLIQIFTFFVFVFCTGDDRRCSGFLSSYHAVFIYGCNFFIIRRKYHRTPHRPWIYFYDKLIFIAILYFYTSSIQCKFCRFQIFHFDRDNFFQSFISRCCYYNLCFAWFLSGYDTTTANRCNFIIF